MARKRSRLDIIKDMLESIRDKNGKMKQTRLMYKANLSHTQMKIYIEELVKKELIEEKAEGSYKYIYITDRGFKFIESLDKIKEFETSFGI